MSTKFSELAALAGVDLVAGDRVPVLDVSAGSSGNKTMTVTELASGLASAGGLATAAQLSAHEADTTNIHGIADTSALATATSLAAAITAHSAASDPHGDRAYADTVGNLKLAKAQNLADLASPSTARTNLGLVAIAASGSASDLSSGTVPTARLGSGGAGAGAKVLADNQTFVTLPVGDVVGPASATNNRVAVFDSTTGKLLKVATAIGQDGSGNLILEDAAGARELWFSSVTGAPKVYRAGAALKVLSNEGNDTVEVQVGSVSCGNASAESYFAGGAIVANGKGISYSDGVDFNRRLGVGVNGNELAAKDASTGFVGFRKKWDAGVVGANVASATTITPTAGIFHLTGTAAVATINVPYTGFTGCIRVIPDGLSSLVTGGNIALASSMVVGRVNTLTYDGSAWYPSY